MRTGAREGSFISGGDGVVRARAWVRGGWCGEAGGLEPAEVLEPGCLRLRRLRRFRGHGSGGRGAFRTGAWLRVACTGGDGVGEGFLQRGTGTGADAGVGGGKCGAGTGCGDAFDGAGESGGVGDLVGVLGQGDGVGADPLDVGDPVVVQGVGGLFGDVGQEEFLCPAVAFAEGVGVVQVGRGGGEVRGEPSGSRVCQGWVRTAVRTVSRTAGMSSWWMKFLACWAIRSRLERFTER